MMLALFIALVALPSPYPDHRAHDFADILPPEIEMRLEVLSRDVDQATTAEIGIVTVASLEGMSVEEYANRLFNEWGVGKRDVNNGVLFLIAPNERRARIEVGYGLEPLITDGLAGEILDDHVIPKFKAGDYPGGILAGTEEIARILKAYPDAARGVGGSAPGFVMTPRKKAVWLGTIAIGCSVLFWLGGMFCSRRRRYPTPLFVAGSLLSLLAAFAAAWHSEVLQAYGWTAAAFATGAFLQNASRYKRYGPRGCRKCGSHLQLLDELTDDKYLDAAQKLEETLGSVDYDVWVCPSCMVNETENYSAWFSSFDTCPKCKRRTYSETSTTLRSATTRSTGLERINGECKSCRHTSSRQEIIPKISESSSGSGGGGGGGSFGGGSSGGGGASRSW